MNTLHFVIVGHVDHGKSTLIGRLLYDTNSLPPDRVEEIKAAARDMGRDAEFAHLLDHLEEERLQGITIETTQVFFKWEGREYVIIDAPGHVEFVKNMITGASHASAAVLIIDAHEGIREQTKRHAYILALLGIRSVIVLINKMDLVAYDEQVYRTIARESAVFLAQVGIMSAPCIPVAALQGENIVTRSAHCVWYNGPTFIEALARMTADRDADILPLRLPVQDVYKVDEKRINVGRIEAGCLHAGDRITIMPHNQTTVIKTIERYRNRLPVPVQENALV